MVDLAEMKGIAIDLDRSIATAEGGVVWAELNTAAAEHGLAVTGGVISTTGIAGYTLGGGLGWLMAKHGLAADNLLAVELVTAEGEVLAGRRCIPPRSLLGAARRRRELRRRDLVHLPPASAADGRGWIDRPSDRGRARPPALLPGSGCGRLGRPVRVRRARARTGRLRAKLAALVVFHTGDVDEAERELEPFKTWGSPLVVDVSPMPYPVMNTILDAGYPAGALNYWLSSSRAVSLTN